MAIDTFVQATFRELESSLTVGTIASSPIVTCGEGDEVEDVLTRSDWSDFDAIPVLDGKRITAVIERGSHSKRSLDSSVLVSSAQPLEEFLGMPGFVDDGYRLVVFGSKIDGIVTPSDLLRLPVRVLVFAHLAHLEMAMGEILDAQHLPDNHWLQYLSPERQLELGEILTQLQADRLNPNLIEYMTFSEKARVLKKIGAMSKPEADNAGGLSELRNQVMHHRDYVRTQTELRRFLNRFQRTRDMINALEPRAQLLQ